MSSPPVETTGPCTRVFWDLMDFPFPDGVDPVSIYKKMQLILENEGFRGQLSIMAYVDEETFSDELYDDYENAGITVIYLPEGSKHHRCRMMFTDITWWLQENCENPFTPRNLIVVSKLDGGKSRFLKHLENWVYVDYNVLLAMPHQPQLTRVISSRIRTRLQTVTFNWLSISLSTTKVQGRTHKWKSIDD
ncbi:unnamed protein product [Arabis nemorensis]|uniref:Uncharacterized protein n=1 Tax=Arabis nemorensis TaxID=586526 RepID=A0A565AMP0_9BRAS|nr:unnamed protein product [Arabis nemorensis]